MMPKRCDRCGRAAMWLNNEWAYGGHARILLCDECTPCDYGARWDRCFVCKEWAEIDVWWGMCSDCRAWAGLAA